MQLLDEQHVVTLISLISLDGLAQPVATARLTADDTLETLREEVERAAGRAANDVMPAFDQAFEQCEATPGNLVSIDVAFASGTVRVERRLAA